LTASVSAEEMDPRMIEAFFRCIVESIATEDLPLEPSDLWKDHLSLYSDKDFKLDFKQTSWKRVSRINILIFIKIGKFLEVMHKRGVVDYTEPKGINHKVITRIHK